MTLVDCNSIIFGIINTLIETEQILFQTTF
jgi:hypothetical protein